MIFVHRSHSTVREGRYINLDIFYHYMSQILQGDAISVLKTLPENSIDCIFTAPSPFGFYENGSNKIGGEASLTDYINSIVNICKECHRVLKKEGSLWVQLPDIFTPYGDLASIPTYFEVKMVLESDFMLNDRVFWHRIEKNHEKRYKERGFLKNYEFLFHFVKDIDQFYFNSHSKYSKSSIFSFPLEDSYYTNEFDSGLPSELSKMVIDTTVPPNGTVLDPLAGSGKVAQVAKKMGRDFILIEIDPEIYELLRIKFNID